MQCLSRHVYMCRHVTGYVVIAVACQDAHCDVCVREIAQPEYCEQCLPGYALKGLPTCDGRWRAGY